jgi:hypothetical protein
MFKPLILFIAVLLVHYTSAQQATFNLEPVDEWKNVTPPVTNGLGVLEVLVDPLHPGTVYTSVDKRGIYKSTNCGDTWEMVNTGRNGSVLNSGQQWSMQIDPVDSRILYANNLYGSDLGLFKTTNGGVDWDPMFPPGSEVAQTITRAFTQEVSMDPTNNNHLAVSFHDNCSGAYAPMCMADTRDGGATWRLFKGPANAWVENARPLIIDSAALLYVDGGTVYYTSDNANAWKNVGAGGGHQLYKAMNGFLYMGGNNGVIRSTDNGATWTKAGNSAPNGDAMIGDGNRLFTTWPACCGSTNSFYTATESSGTDWKTYPGPNLKGARAVYFAYDKNLNLMYAACTQAGLWRVVTRQSSGTKTIETPIAAKGMTSRRPVFANRMVTCVITEGAFVRISDMQGRTISHSSRPGAFTWKASGSGSYVVTLQQGTHVVRSTVVVP